jgi:hypothetical protein
MTAGLRFLVFLGALGMGTLGSQVPTLSKGADGRRSALQPCDCARIGSEAAAFDCAEHPTEASG